MVPLFHSKPSFLSFSKPFLPFVSHSLEDIAILEFHDQVRKLTKAIAQVKKAIKEPPYFDGIGLDTTIYFKMVSNT